VLTIGDIIRTNRVQQKITQEELSFGICTTSNLSRIENGTQIPSRIKYEAFMERLGVAPDVFPSFLSDREIEMFRLKHRISRCVDAEQYEEAERLLEKLEPYTKNERIYEQYVQFMCTVMRGRSGQYPPEQALQEMLEVVRLSVKDISPDRIIHQALSKDDILMIRSLAIFYKNAGMQEIGIEYLYAVKEYIERKVRDDEGISPLYTATLHTLTNWLGLSGRHDEVLNLCDIGIKRCIDYGAYFSFSALLFNKGYALVMLGRKDEARKFLQEAYYTSRARGRMDLCEIMTKFADEHGVEL